VGTWRWEHFTQELNEDYTSFTVTMSGGSGDVDLYVRHGAESSRRRYDCRSNDSGNNESCTFDAPKVGSWYIDLYGYSAASNIKLNIQANP